MAKKCFLGVKKFRMRMGLKQIELAKELGCKNPNTYNRWELGKREAPFEIVQKLFEMGATVEELFGVECKEPAGEALLQNLLKRVERLEAGE